MFQGLHFAFLLKQKDALETRLNNSLFLFKLKDQFLFL